MNRYLRLLRPQQWYKNIVIFIALFFSLSILDPTLFLKCVAGFFALSFTSSSYYIINDIRDIKEDRKHPEKKKRPLASGEVTKGVGMTISVSLLAAALVTSYALNPLFAVFPILLFASTMAYTFCLKNVPIIDIHMISLNFLLRTASGAVLLGLAISPWLVITIFLIALVLAIGKRKSELEFLGKNAAKHKKVYEFYTSSFLDILFAMSLSMLIMSYTLYTFIAHPESFLIFTLPIVTFILFRYTHFVLSGRKASRSTEYIFKDKQMLAGFAAWLISLIFLFYVI